MQFELMTPTEQAAMMAAMALMVFAITHACDRLFAWYLTLRDRRSRRSSYCVCPPTSKPKRDGKG